MDPGIVGGGEAAATNGDGGGRGSAGQPGSGAAPAEGVGQDRIWGGPREGAGVRAAGVARVREAGGGGIAGAHHEPARDGGNLLQSGTIRGGGDGFGYPAFTSDKIYDGFEYPAFTFEEQETASALPFNRTPFVESVRKRGLEFKDVVCLAFTVGWYGEEKQERKLASLMCFVTGETMNLYMRPLEGVKMLVDLDTMEIMEYKDRMVVPVPKAAEMDYRVSKQEPPFGPQTKPRVVV